MSGNISLPKIRAFAVAIIMVMLFAACTSSHSSENETLSDTQSEAEGQVPSMAEMDRNLLTAAANGDVDTTRNLIVQGADVHVTDARGFTPLIAAAYMNHVEVARVLIEAGADVNVQDQSQQSAFLISTSEGYLELLQLTLAAGADVSSLDSYHGTGLIRAADRGHVEIIEALLQTDIEIDHVNRLGWTALLEAIILGDGGPRHTEVVRLLVEAGADVHLPDSNGVTPLDHARQRGYSEIVTILEAGSQFPGSANAPENVSSTSQATASSPVSSQHPLFPFTIPGLRQRDFPGGQIQVRMVMAQNEAFTQSYIEYPSDGLTITGLMYLPTGTGPFPTLILLHGYIDRDLYFAGADTWQAAEYFARQGYLVLAPDLRSWGESDVGLSIFHMGLAIDVLNLISSLVTLPESDPARIGLWGHSMGGGISTKVLTIDPRVRAAVLYAPNSADDADLIARWGAGCLPGQSQSVGDLCNPAEIIPPGISQNLVDAYLEAAADPDFLPQVAPYYHLEKIDVPVQIHIGTADGQALAETPTEWSLKLAEALQAAGRDVAIFTYDDQGHFFSGSSWVLFQERALAFFNEQLKGES